MKDEKEIGSFTKHFIHSTSYSAALQRRRVENLASGEWEARRDLAVTIYRDAKITNIEVVQQDKVNSGFVRSVYNGS